MHVILQNPETLKQDVPMGQELYQSVEEIKGLLDTATSLMRVHSGRHIVYLLISLKPGRSFSLDQGRRDQETAHLLRK